MDICPSQPLSQSPSRGFNAFWVCDTSAIARRDSDSGNVMDEHRGRARSWDCEGALR